MGRRSDEGSNIVSQVASMSATRGNLSRESDISKIVEGEGKYHGSDGSDVTMRLAGDRWGY